MRYVMTWDGLGDAPAGVERHCPILWNKWEYQPGKYDFAAVDRMLAASAKPDARPGPCHLQIVISMYGRQSGLVDYTPGFHKRSLRARASNGKTGEIPNYADKAWRAALYRAQDALAERYGPHPQVVSYEAAVGVNQESQATVVTADGTDWHVAFAPLLAEDAYCDFISEDVERLVRAWAPKPVYVPGAPAPGGTWGHKRRDAVVAALAAGGRYLMCGLLPDNSNATGLGVRAGQGLTDIIRATGAGCAFEGGKAAGDISLELYWLLLRARHWGADFVQLQRSWFEKGHWAAVKDLLPADDARWIVFRDSEWPAQTQTGADGKQYGFTGELGPWGCGLRWVSGGTLVKDLARVDLGRWWLRTTAGESVVLEGVGSGLPDAEYEARTVDCTGMICVTRVTASGGQVTLPGGTGYHRVELRAVASEPPIVVHEPLPADEPVATAEKVRWWTEEAVRQLEAGQTARMTAILYSLVKLARRLEEAK